MQDVLGRTDLVVLCAVAEDPKVDALGTVVCDSQGLTDQNIGFLLIVEDDFAVAELEVED